MEELVARDLEFQINIQSLNAEVASLKSDLDNASSAFSELTSQCNDEIQSLGVDVAQLSAEKTEMSETILELQSDNDSFSL
jgi:chromosome segregation ATPase